MSMAYNSGGAPAGSTTSLAALHGDDAVLKLIDVVKAEEVLWNYTEVPRDAESVRQLAEAWDRVTELMMGIYPKASRTVLRTTWKSLRHRHRRRGFTNTGNYKWRDHMAFLNEVVEPLDESSSSATAPKPANRKRRSTAPALQPYDVDDDVDDSDLPFTFSQSPSVGNGPKPTKVARQTSADRGDYYGPIIGRAASSSSSSDRLAAGSAVEDSESRREYGNGAGFSTMELLVAKVEAEDSSSDTSASGNVVEADIPDTVANDENNFYNSMDLTTLASRWSAEEGDNAASITELDQDYEVQRQYAATRRDPARTTTNKLNGLHSNLSDYLKPTQSSAFAAQLAAASADLKPNYAFGDLIRDRMTPLTSGPARWRAEGLILSAVEQIVSDLCKESPSISN